MTIPGANPLAYEGVTANNPPNLLRAARAPTTQDLGQPLGTFWLNTATDTMYVLVSLSAGSATWDAFGGGSAGVDTINSLSPTAGNIVLAGTASQLTATSGGSTVTYSLPAAITAPGSLTTTTTVTGGTGVVATTGDVTSTAGDLVATVGNVSLPGAGSHIEIEGGALTDFIGVATLDTGTATVANTSITAADKIMVTRSSINGSTALGVLEVVKTPTTNFVINSRDPADATIETADVSIIEYVIVRQL